MPKKRAPADGAAHTARQQRLSEQAERRKRTAYLATMLVHPVDLEAPVPAGSAKWWTTHKYPSKQPLVDCLVAAYGIEGPQRLTHRLVACATDDDANEEVRAWHRDKDPGPGPGDNWGFWDGSQLLVIDGRARLKAETTWVAREEGRSKDFWLVDVYSSVVLGQEGFPLYFAWRIETPNPVAQARVSDAEICQAYIQAVHTTDDRGWLERRNDEHEAWFIVDHVIGPKYLERLRKLCQNQALALAVDTLLQIPPYRAAFKIYTWVDLMTAKGAGLIWWCFITATIARVKLMVVIDPDSTCTNQEEADAAKDFTSGFFASPNVFDQLDGLDVPPLQHIVVDRRSGTLSIEDLDDEEFEERRQVAIDQLETLITSHPKAAGTLETFRDFVNELPRAIQPQDSGLWTNVFLTPGCFAKKSLFAKAVGRMCDWFIHPVMLKLAEVHPETGSVLPPQKRNCLVRCLAHARNVDPLRISADSLETFAAFIVHHEDEVMASVANMSLNCRPNKSIAFLDSNADNPPLNGSRHLDYIHLALPLRALNSPNIDTSSLPWADLMGPDEQVLKDEVWLGYKILSRTQHAVPNGSRELPDVSADAQRPGRKRRATSEDEDDYEDDGDDQEANEAGPKRVRRGATKKRSNAQSMTPVELVTTRLAELRDVLEEMGVEGFEVEIEESAGDARKVEVALTFSYNMDEGN